MWSYVCCATNNALLVIIVVPHLMHDQSPQEKAMTNGNSVNYVQASNGKVRAVCQCCGAKSKPAKPCNDGEPDLFYLGRGWSEAPYPVDCEHSDGSRGSTYTCPKCNKRLHAGETLRLREYLRGSDE